MPQIGCAGSSRRGLPSWPNLRHRKLYKMALVLSGSRLDDKRRPYAISEIEFIISVKALLAIEHTRKIIAMARRVIEI